MGECFFLQFSHVDSGCYQLFLDQFSKAYPDSLNILQVDNGAFHKAKSLVIPDNIILLFQPPYSPELNPIERLCMPRQLHWPVASITNPVPPVIVVWFASITPLVKR
jgi:hypothetical protein